MKDYSIQRQIVRRDKIQGAKRYNMAGLAVGVEIASVLRHLGGCFISHVVGKRRFRPEQLIYSCRECKKGSRFWRKGNDYSLGFWTEVSVKYSSGDTCFFQLLG